jgi:hypothetical protein
LTVPQRALSRVDRKGFRCAHINMLIRFHLIRRAFNASVRYAFRRKRISLLRVIEMSFLDKAKKKTEEEAKKAAEAAKKAGQKGAEGAKKAGEKIKEAGEKGIEETKKAAHKVKEKID